MNVDEESDSIFFFILNIYFRLYSAAADEIVVLVATGCNLGPLLRKPRFFYPSRFLKTTLDCICCC